RKTGSELPAVQTPTEEPLTAARHGEQKATLLTATGPLSQLSQALKTGWDSKTPAVIGLSQLSQVSQPKWIDRGIDGMCSVIRARAKKLGTLGTRP
ncbi:hypothetical protein, partial [Xylella fastidiosa]